jgi:immune inhibitor A
MNETTLRLLQSQTILGEISEPSTLVLPGQAQGTWQALVILIDFPDYRWNHQSDENFANQDSLYTPDHFNDMLFSLGTYKDPYSQSAYTGSMRDFYLENSYGDFEVTGATTVWYTAEHPLAYYTNGSSGLRGPYPNNARRLVEEAVELAAPNVDFSQYDNNGDGVVDALFVVHAGPGAEEIYTRNFAQHFNYLWSHKSFIQTKLVDGVQVRGYTLEPQNGTIGVFCHEFGHELGLPDLYDTNDAIPSEGIGEWCLMGSGGWCFRAGDQLGTSPAHFSAWSKAQLGWLHPINLAENLTALEIPPAETNKVAYRIWRNGEIGPEYFLIENRQVLGFDAGLTRRQKDFGLADPAGLIIYHVDHFGQQGNENRRLIDVEEASPFFTETDYLEQLDLPRLPPAHEFLYNGNRGDNGDPFPGFSLVNDQAADYIGERDRAEFSESTIPNSNDNAGFPTHVRISNIRQVGENMVVDIAIQIITAVEDGSDSPSLPANFSLSSNFPNPFNPTTLISYTVPTSAKNGVRVQIVIYNLKGERVRVLTDRTHFPGAYTVNWDGRADDGAAAASGIYLYRMQAGDFLQSKKMALLR